MAFVDSLRLDGKAALVTGAGKGLGAALAVAYAEMGADVALLARTIEDMEAVAGQVEARGRRAVILNLDLLDPDAWGAAVESTVAELGKLDILANAAGVNRRVPVLEANLEDWDFVVNSNLRQVFFLCQAAGRHMVARKQGKIINFASTNAFRSLPDISLYALTKAAVARFTASLAVEWAAHNVQVNAIAPGWIETPMIASMRPERRRWVDAHVPQGHAGQPRDIVGLGVYLASPASDYTTGQTFVVDGGFIAGSTWECCQ